MTDPVGTTQADLPDADACPECGEGDVHIEVVTKSGGSGGLATWLHNGKTIWMIPMHLLEGGYAWEVTLSCSACGWELDLDENSWEAGR